MKKYKPYYLCNYNDDYNGESVSFNTEIEARNWIVKNGLCDSCKNVNEPLSSQCAAEWIVEEYDEI